MRKKVQCFGSLFFFRFFSSVATAIEYVVKMKLLDNAYVEDFTLRQNPTSNAVVPTTVWTKLGDAMRCDAAIGQWTIDGLIGMDAVAQFGKILALFRALKSSLRATAVRRCPVFNNTALRGFVNQCCPGVQWT